MSKKSSPLYTPKELAAAICIEALIGALRHDHEWLEDASPQYRREAFNAIEKLAALIGHGYNHDFVLPERKYSDD